MNPKEFEAFAREAAQTIKMKTDLDNFRKMLTKASFKPVTYMAKIN